MRRERITDSDLLTALDQSGLHAGAEYTLNAGREERLDRTPVLRAVLPDGTVAERRTIVAYRFLVAVETNDNGWQPYRWVLRESDLPGALSVAAAIHGHTQTLEVEQ